MVAFGRPVIRQRLNFSHDGLAKQLVLAHLPNHVVSNSFVLGVSPVNAAAVLRAAVIALAVQGGWVMNNVENFQNLIQADLLGVKL